jgi:hypothetical protein
VCAALGLYILNALRPNFFKFSSWSASEWGIWFGSIAQAALAVSLLLTFRQLRADHERSRRERTLELMEFWTTTIVPHARRVYAMRDLVIQLESKQCEAIWKAEDLRVDSKHKYLVALVLDSEIEKLKLSEGGEFVRLEREQVQQIREVASFYMNCLEVIFCAWRHNIGESKFIDDEFGPLLAPHHGGFPLDQLRMATGVYPSIASFIAHKKKLEEARPTSNPIA